MKRFKADMPPPDDASAIADDDYTVIIEAYLDEVKETFLDQREKYLMILEILGRLRARRPDYASLIPRLKELLRGYNHLIRRLNIFLPNEFQIDIEEDAASPRQIKFNQGVAFCEKVKERLDNVDKYWDFVEHMPKFTTGRIPKQVLQNSVDRILGEHHDLVDEFNQLLENENFNEFVYGVLIQSLAPG